MFLDEIKFDVDFIADKGLHLVAFAGFYTKLILFSLPFIFPLRGFDVFIYVGRPMALFLGPINLPYFYIICARDAYTTNSQSPAGFEISFSHRPRLISPSKTSSDSLLSKHLIHLTIRRTGISIPRNSLLRLSSYSPESDRKSNTLTHSSHLDCLDALVRFDLLIEPLVIFGCVPLTVIPTILVILLVAAIAWFVIRPVVEMVILGSSGLADNRGGSKKQKMRKEKTE